MCENIYCVYIKNKVWYALINKNINFIYCMRILVIEDDKDLINFLKPSLEAENFVVDAVRDGEEGSFLARTNDYDLVILDYNLPRKDGCQICEDIRKDGKNTPIIVVSVKSEVDAKVNLLNIGADDYLTKPFSFAELLARINALLRRPQKIENEILIVNDLALDTASQTVKYKEKDIYFTRKEFELLKYLMKNQGKVLTRAIIMEHVWDMNADPFSNTVETHILNLRRKIDRKSGNKIIQTVPGRGYKIG